MALLQDFKAALALGGHAPPRIGDGRPQRVPTQALEALSLAGADDDTGV